MPGRRLLQLLKKAIPRNSLPAGHYFSQLSLRKVECIIQYKKKEASWWNSKTVSIIAI